jgi:hypothetical protein
LFVRDTKDLATSGNAGKVKTGKFTQARLPVRVQIALSI